MDFSKLVSLFDSQQLYFARGDRFSDPFEGAWPSANRDNFRALLEQTGVKNHQLHELGRIAQLMPKFVTVNCWHMNNYESAAMWNLYLKSDEGIAIQSTYRKLKDSITDEEPFYLGLVDYRDYETEAIDSLFIPHCFHAFFSKRRSFVHEREVRALVSMIPTRTWPKMLTLSDFETTQTISGGIRLKVDLDLLIENIYVAPTAPDWFSDLVQSVAKRYGYTFHVRHSRLNEDPIF
jgi:hypothetical protein